MIETHSHTVLGPTVVRPRHMRKETSLTSRQLATSVSLFLCLANTNRPIICTGVAPAERSSSLSLPPRWDRSHFPAIITTSPRAIVTQMLFSFFVRHSINDMIVFRWSRGDRSLQTVTYHSAGMFYWDRQQWEKMEAVVNPLAHRTVSSPFLEKINPGNFLTTPYHWCK